MYKNILLKNKCPLHSKKQQLFCFSFFTDTVFFFSRAFSLLFPIIWRTKPQNKTDENISEKYWFLILSCCLKAWKKFFGASGEVSNIVYWDNPPPLFQDLAPPLVVVITPKYRTYTYHTWYGVRAVIVLCYISYKLLSYSSPCAINSRIHYSCFTRE